MESLHSVIKVHSWETVTSVRVARDEEPDNGKTLVDSKPG
jgi:hypothetical protein